MAVALLDSSVVIDILRKFPDAETWLRQTPGQLGVTEYVWMEVLEGALSKSDQVSAVTLLNRFEKVPTTQEDHDWTIIQLLELVPGYNGLSMKDVLIASTSHRLQLPLYTRNLKHFEPLLGALAIQPY